MGAPKGTAPWNKDTGQGWVDKRGYRWLYVFENGKRRARREHRVLMERHLGRRLEPWEIVHHKDENPSNNAINNLEVVEFGKHTASHHKGARRDADTRRSLEAFALLRQELLAERAIKAELLEALRDMLAGWKYIRSRYGDLHGVGWDRAQVKAEEAMSKATGERA